MPAHLPPSCARATLAAILGGLMLLPTAGQARTEIKEATTGAAFARTRHWGNREMVCVGTGVYKKLFIKVWAGCLYLDRAVGKQRLLELIRQRGGRLDKERLLQDPAFYRWLHSSDIPWVLDTTLTTGMGTADRARSTIREEAAPYAGSAGAELDQLLSVISPAAGARKWDHITFVSLPGYRVNVHFARAIGPTVRSRQASRALLGIVLGERVSASWRRGFLEQIDRLLE